MAKKPARHADWREVTYNHQRWLLLKEYRERSLRVMEALEKSLLESVVHGSIARGDVTKKSDIDIFILTAPSSFAVEVALEKAEIPVIRRLLVQATPVYAMKAYLEIDNNTRVSFPLMRMRRVEREFYRFGGEISIADLRENLRVSGVDKRLMLIEPTRLGHRETSIVGREEQAAKTLGVSVETVLDRVHALLKRDMVGRTGVFIERELSSDETFEQTLKRLADEKPAVRRRLTKPF